MFVYRIGLCERNGGFLNRWVGKSYTDLNKALMVARRVAGQNRKFIAVISADYGSSSHGICCVLPPSK